VTDDLGAVDTDMITIFASSGNVTGMHVSDIYMQVNSKGINSTGLAGVSLVDEYGNPVDNAVVSGSWSGIVQQDQTGATDDSGYVLFPSPKTKLSGTMIFTIENVAKPDFTYLPDDNVETWDSIDTP
jgi:hypothetical protein